MPPWVFAQKVARYADPPTSGVARIQGNGQGVRAALLMAESDENSEIGVRVKGRAAAKTGDAFATERRDWSRPVEQVSSMASWAESWQAAWVCRNRGNMNERLLGSYRLASSSRSR